MFSFLSHATKLSNIGSWSPPKSKFLRSCRIFVHPVKCYDEVAADYWPPSESLEVRGHARVHGSTNHGVLISTVKEVEHK